MANLEEEHPEYQRWKCSWETIRDAHEGEEWVKSLLDKYLPPTSGMCKAWSPSNTFDMMRYSLTRKQWDKYRIYLNRAEFPDQISEMVTVALGILWNREATIELPPEMEYLRENATSMGESLQDFMVRINTEQLLVQRCGIMLDMPQDRVLGVPRPYLCLYTAESITNWDAGSRIGDAYSKLNLVVLNESDNVRIDAFTRQWVKKYRVLALGPTNTNELTGVYRWGQFVDSDFDEEAMQVAEFLGQPIPFIPFYFINGTHCLPCVEKPRSAQLALKCLSVYKNSADYEQALHEQAQETLVVEGGDEDKEYKTGSGAAITPPAGQKVYYAGLQGKGLPEQRAAMANKMVALQQLSGQMIDLRSLQRESGEALATRIASQTATLSSIARTCGKGVQKALRDLASLLGLDPEMVVIKPNTSFLNPELFAKTLVELMQAKTMGYPITNQDLHRLAQERGVSQSDWETVQKLLKMEEPMVITPGIPIANPSGNAPEVITPPAPPGGAKAPLNPTGISARGKTRTTSKKNK